MSDRLPFPEHAWPLMRKALEHIAAHPGEFYMGLWWVGADFPQASDVQWSTGMPFPACGTAACLGGRICIEAGATPGDDFISGGEALRHLGIDDVSPAGIHLREVFNLIDIRTYAELCADLSARFSFPEPLPAVPEVTP